MKIAANGFAGELLSSLPRRIQNLPTERDPLLTMLELEHGRFTVGLAPVTGAIFAVVLFLVFLGGLLQGALFPAQLSFSNWKLGDPIDAVSLESFGKLLLWSFIAGFAERFVPDTLDSLTAKSREAAKPVAVPNADEPRDQELPGMIMVKKPRKKRAGQE